MISHEVKLEFSDWQRNVAESLSDLDVRLSYGREYKMPNLVAPHDIGDENDLFKVKYTVSVWWTASEGQRCQAMFYDDVAPSTIRRIIEEKLS